MGLAYFIVLEQDIPGFDPFVNGKALAWAADALDPIARSLGVTPLADFHSMDPGEIEGFLEAHDADVPADLPAEQWFAAAEGLKTVEALRDHLRQQPKTVRDAATVLEDLEEFHAVLTRVQEAGVRWHLQVDF